MKSDDARGARGTSGTEREGGRPDVPRSPVPRPAGPPPAAPPMPIGAPRSGPSAAPPMPAGLPGAGPSTAEWLNTVRPAAEPGVWRYGHVPRPAERPPRPSLLGPLLALVLWLVIWALLADFRIPYIKVPLEAVTPGAGGSSTLCGQGPFPPPRTASRRSTTSCWC